MSGDRRQQRGSNLSLVVNVVRQRVGAGTIGHHGSSVRALGIVFALEDNQPRRLLGAGLVVKAGEELLWLTSFFVLFYYFLQ